MAVTGWKYAGTTANVDRDSKSEWSFPDNAKADDSSYASVYGKKNTYSDWILLTNFGFSSSDIPSGSTINGIEFIINKSANIGGAITDSGLYLYNSGAVGNNLASATTWAAAETEITYGGPTNMCGTTLTQANIVSTNFGVQLSIGAGGTEDTAKVDYIKIRVYYTAGGATVKPYYYYLNQ